MQQILTFVFFRTNISLTWFNHFCWVERNLVVQILLEGFWVQRTRMKLCKKYWRGKVLIWVLMDEAIYTVIQYNVLVWQQKAGLFVFLRETTDMSGNAHTAEYLEAAVKAVRNCEQQFQCHMQSFVADNAENVAKMRRQWSKSVPTYGCIAHLVHLLAKDLSTPGIKENVVEIIP